MKRALNAQCDPKSATATAVSAAVSETIFSKSIVKLAAMLAAGSWHQANLPTVKAPAASETKPISSGIRSSSWSIAAT